MKLTVVLPTYNESENLARLVETILALPMSDLRILVVDDNSPDGTGVLAEELARKMPESISVIRRKGKWGFGTACLRGFKQALLDGADAIGQMDADFSHPPEKLPELLDALREFDVALGSRYVPGGGVDKDWPGWRKFLSAFGNFYARTILGLQVRDATGGYRVWKRDVLLNMPLHSLKSNGYSFQVEMIHIAQQHGYRLTEIPIYFKDRRFGTSKMSLRIQIEAAVRVWQLKYAYNNLKTIPSVRQGHSRPQADSF